MSWKEDARFVGAFVRGGDWEIGLRIARSVEVNAGEGGKPRSSTRISVAEFAREAGISDKTVAKYLAAWEWAAGEGLVDHAADLNPADEYDFSMFPQSAKDENGEWVDGCWKAFYEIAVMNPPPWNPQGKPLDSNYGGGRQEKAATKPSTPTREQIQDAIKTDPSVRLAAREAIEEVEIERTQSRARQHSDVAAGERPLTDLVSLSTSVRAAKRDLQDLLTKVIEFKDYPEGRQIVGEYVDELQRYLDAIRQAAMGNSFDAELARLIEEGV